MTKGKGVELVDVGVSSGVGDGGGDMGGEASMQSGKKRRLHGILTLKSIAGISRSTHRRYRYF